MTSVFKIICYELQNCHACFGLHSFIFRSENSNWFVSLKYIFNLIFSPTLKLALSSLLGCNPGVQLFAYFIIFGSQEERSSAWVGLFACFHDNAIDVGRFPPGSNTS